MQVTSFRLPDPSISEVKVFGDFPTARRDGNRELRFGVVLRRYVLLQAICVERNGFARLWRGPAHDSTVGLDFDFVRPDRNAPASIGDILTVSDDRAGRGDRGRF